jgi:hypothetical protein
MRQEKTIMRAPELQSGPVRRWRIHIGAHKTATTHLQETLTALRPALAAQGVDYIPNSLVRGRKLAPNLWRRRPITRLPIIGPARMREALEAVLEPLRLGPSTVAISEENILGVPHQLLATPIYGHAALHVARLASLGQRAEIEIFLSIRSYDMLLPSAYAESLKHAPPGVGGFEALRARLLAAPPSWFDLVSRIRAAAPEVPLRIWRQEDYRANAHAIMQAFCGCEIGVLPEISDPTWTRSPSAEGIAAAEALPHTLTRAERDARVRAIFASPSGERYQPFTPEERRHLRAAYDADLERIAASFPDLLMRFAPRELAA